MGHEMNVLVYGLKKLTLPCAIKNTFYGRCNANKIHEH